MARLCEFCSSCLDRIWSTDHICPHHRSAVRHRSDALRHICAADLLGILVMLSGLHLSRLLYFSNYLLLNEYIGSIEIFIEEINLQIKSEVNYFFKRLYRIVIINKIITANNY